VGLHQPEVVVLDITMPRLGGLETLERLRAKYPDVKVILLSVHGDPPFIQSAISLGADGYVLKNGRAGASALSKRGSPGWNCQPDTGIFFTNSCRRGRTGAMMSLAATCGAEPAFCAN
jgi:hypothetical protein